MATYCNECGAMLQEGETVCRRCGTPVEGQAVEKVQPQLQPQLQEVSEQTAIQPYQQAPIQNVTLFNDLKPYYREEFSKIYEGNGSYRGKFNMAAFLLWGSWYLTHLGGLKGIMMLVCWIVLLVTAPVGVGILGLLGVGVIAGVNSTSQYYIKYMQKIGMQK